MTHLSPMQICERVIGTPEAIAEICGCQPKSPYGWRQASLNRGAGDIPSARHMRALLAHAAARGLPLLPDDLIWGVAEAELSARLARHVFPAGTCSASSEQPEDCGGGSAPAAFSFRSRVGRRGQGGVMQAASPARAGEEAPLPATFPAGAVAHG